MRKIVMAGVAAVLAFGLTACDGGDGGTSAASSPSASPSAVPSVSSSSPAVEAPSGGPSSEPSASRPSSGGSSSPARPIASKWGRLRYLAPGKFTVGDVAFFTADRTVVIVAGGTCPDGSEASADGSRCGIDGLEEWAKASPHNVNVRFSGQVATTIMETQ
ncbi:hypothetical protein [Actinomadura parmotrematis]|uniref:Lipoprotein n=1 Tax=Actinomadura parmotrematis TaxID=2864039 RepID=A0ABS7FNL7_9ACTN|nr:hypothetical protein [Actinomadura parmotrematis]MBW8481825.1 hypothetical protein [Actinomadura parmotrematis]